MEALYLGKFCQELAKLRFRFSHVCAPANNAIIFQFDVLYCLSLGFYFCSIYCRFHSPSGLFLFPRWIFPLLSSCRSRNTIDLLSRHLNALSLDDIDRSRTYVLHLYLLPLQTLAEIANPRRNRRHEQARSFTLDRSCLSRCWQQEVLLQILS